MGKDLYYLSQAQLESIRPYFPLFHGVRRVDDRTVLSGIIDVIKNGLQWKDAPVNTVCTKPSTTGSSGGAAWESSIKSSWSFPGNVAPPVDDDKILYRQRHKVENMFGRIKDWRKIAMRYDQCAHIFLPAICVACCVILVNESRTWASVIVLLMYCGTQGMRGMVCRALMIIGFGCRGRGEVECCHGGDWASGARWGNNVFPPRVLK